MARFALRYLLLVGGLLFVFINFIACGSQLYQVSLKDDFDDSRAANYATDPTSSLYGIHAPHGWQDLPIEFRYGSTLTKSQQELITKAMHTWEKAVGKQLFKNLGKHTNVDGDSFNDLYSSLQDNINGHYFDADWQKTAKPQLVLATTIWDNVGGDPNVIARSDIRYNTEYYILGNSLFERSTEAKEMVDLQSLALHELGHLLGLAHVQTDHDAYSIMNPYLYIGERLTARKLSRGDIERIQTIYGCEDSACDIDQILAELEQDDKDADPTNGDDPNAGATSYETTL